MNKKTMKRNRKEGSRVGEEETLPLDNKIGINQYDEKQLQQTDNQYLYFSKIPLLLKKKKTLKLDLRKKEKLVMRMVHVCGPVQAHAFLTRHTSLQIGVKGLTTEEENILGRC